jgi:hypothetical protein
MTEKFPPRRKEEAKIHSRKGVKPLKRSSLRLCGFAGLSFSLT